MLCSLNLKIWAVSSDRSNPLANGIDLLPNHVITTKTEEVLHSEWKSVWTSKFSCMYSHI